MAWSKRFGKYLQDKGIDRVQAAFELGVSYATIHYWIKGQKFPSAAYQARVEKWTKGAVRSVPGGSPRIYGQTGS